MSKKPLSDIPSTEVAPSPLRRSSRISQALEAAPISTRRSSASEMPSTPSKLTRGRRLSQAQENDIEQPSTPSKRVTRSASKSPTAVAKERGATPIKKRRGSASSLIDEESENGSRTNSPRTTRRLTRSTSVESPEPVKKIEMKLRGRKPSVSERASTLEAIKETETTAQIEGDQTKKDSKETQLDVIKESDAEEKQVNENGHKEDLEDQGRKDLKETQLEATEEVKENGHSENSASQMQQDLEDTSKATDGDDQVNENAKKTDEQTSKVGLEDTPTNETKELSKNEAEDLIKQSDDSISETSNLKMSNKGETETTPIKSKLSLIKGKTPGPDDSKMENSSIESIHLNISEVCNENSDSKSKLDESASSGSSDKENHSLNVSKKCKVMLSKDDVIENAIKRYSKGESFCEPMEVEEYPSGLLSITCPMDKEGDRDKSTPTKGDSPKQSLRLNVSLDQSQDLFTADGDNKKDSMNSSITKMKQNGLIDSDSEEEEIVDKSTTSDVINLNSFQESSKVTEAEVNQTNEEAVLNTSEKSIGLGTEEKNVSSMDREDLEENIESNEKTCSPVKNVESELNKSDAKKTSSPKQPENSICEKDLDKSSPIAGKETILEEVQGNDTENSKMVVNQEAELGTETEQNVESQEDIAEDKNEKDMQDDKEENDKVNVSSENAKTKRKSDESLLEVENTKKPRRSGSAKKKKLSLTSENRKSLPQIKVESPAKVIGEDFTASQNDIEEKLILLAKEHVDVDSSDEESMDGFIDDMAEESEEDTPSDGSNDIIDEGESVGSTESEVDSNDSYTQDSFVVDDDEEVMELLSGDEYDLGDDKKQKSYRRIIDDSDEDLETTAATVTQVQTSPLESNQLVLQVPERTRKTSSSITLQENVSLEDIEDGYVGTKLGKVIEYFCSTVKQSAENTSGTVSLNISLDYVTPSNVENAAEIPIETPQHSKERPPRSGRKSTTPKRKSTPEREQEEMHELNKSKSKKIKLAEEHTGNRSLKISEKISTDIQISSSSTPKGEIKLRKKETVNKIDITQDGSCDEESSVSEVGNTKFLDTRAFISESSLKEVEDDAESEDTDDSSFNKSQSSDLDEIMEVEDEKKVQKQKNKAKSNKRDSFKKSQSQDLDEILRDAKKDISSKESKPQKSNKKQQETEKKETLQYFPEELLQKVGNTDFRSSPLQMSAQQKIKPSTSGTDKNSKVKKSKTKPSATSSDPSWDTEAVDFLMLQPSNSNKLIPPNQLRSGKPFMGGVFFEKLDEKDFKNRMLYDPQRVKRMETRKLLKTKPKCH